MSERVDRLLGGHVVRECVNGALREACRINAERYDESVGDNAWTFGTSVAQSTYHFVRGRLTDLVGSGDFSLKIDRPRNAFRVRTPLCGMYFYKSAPDVHRLRFTQSITKAGIISTNRLTLPGFENLQELDTVDEWFQNIVVAYVASPFEGLLSAYAGAPTRDGRAGSPWAWVDRIYIKNFDGPDIDFGFNKPDPPLTGPGSPQVLLRQDPPQELPGSQ